MSKFNKENFKSIVSPLNITIEEFDSKERPYFNVYFRTLGYSLDKILSMSEESFPKEDIEVIKFLQVRRDKYNIINPSLIKVYPENIRDFISTLKGKKFKLRFGYKNYEPRIIQEDVPLQFNIKTIGDSVLIRDKVNHPIPLNKEGSIFIYDRNIYLPTKTQSEVYIKVFNLIRLHNGIEINKATDRENLIKVLTIINNLSKDIIIDSKTINVLEELVDINFYFFEKENYINCYVKLKLLNKVHSLGLIKELDGSLISTLKALRDIKALLNENKFYLREDTFIYSGDMDEYNEFLVAALPKLRLFGKVMFKDKNLITSYDKLNIGLDIMEHSNNGVYVDLVGEDLEELTEIMAAYEDNKDYFKTTKGKFINLKSEGVLYTIKLIKNMNLTNTNYIHEGKSLYLQNSLRNNGFINYKGQEILDKIIEDKFNIDRDKVKVPESFQGILREYQKEGFYFLESLAQLSLGGILGDEMGLGKTIQTISFLVGSEGATSLIITPTSLIYNWKNELERFGGNLKVLIIHGDKGARYEAYKKIDEYDVVLTTYGTLKNDIDMYSNQKFNYCIIDEAQNIKNHKTKISEAVKSIESENRFALTGTPIENNLLELWSIFDFLMPGYLYTREEFRDIFVKSGAEGLKELTELINPFILRRLKKDVLTELPDKIQKRFYVEMTDRQEKLYNATLKGIRKDINSSKTLNINLLSYLTRLRQIALDPRLIDESYLGGSGKINIALKLIEEGKACNNKILLFSQFTSLLKNFFKELEKREIKYLYLDGSITAKERIRLVEEFNKDSSITVFVISLKAGGTGLNLTTANTVIHLDPWWNPAVEDQATDRAHRFGQESVVTEIKLISQNTIEEEIIKLQDSKKELIEGVLNNEEINSANITGLNSEELRRLFM